MNSIAFSACALTPPSTFQDMHYSPTVLLPVPLEPSILAGHDYRRALSHGFDAYFEEMYTWNEHRTDLVFVDRFYTLAELQSLLIHEMAPYPLIEASLGFRIGFLVGWLSALALTDRALAFQGLEVLLQLVALATERQEADAR